MSLQAWIATRKGLFELRHEGARGWQVAGTHFLGDPVSMVLPRGAGAQGGRMLAGLNLGHFGVKVQASDDGGKTWHELPAPTYPPQPEGAPGPAWKLVQIWSLERDGQRLWCGTNPGGLFRSDDGGASWALQHGLWDRPERLEWFGGGYDSPGIHSICPHPQQPEELLLGISCGGVWRTTDAAQRWELLGEGLAAEYMPPELQGALNTQDPHRIVRCAAQPEVLWCQHHCGLWRSTDNGRHWQRLHAPVSSFGFAAAAHPADAATAWFVPALRDQCRVPVDGALCVQRTRDGGQSFEVLRSGLPQQGCYDLVYRHGLAVDASGRHLLMGSTTGGLWASDDGGEHWQDLTLRLPPIYAVRFEGC